jgi:signal transduction histidine kinase
VADDELRENLLAGIDRLERGIDEVIAEARRPVETPASCDLAGIVGDRAAFWQVLADEQGRDLRVSIPGTPVPVPLSEHDLAAVVDALLGNVFDHTPPGTAFSIEVVADPVPTFVVRDDGPGFPPGLDPVARGASGAGSTGLGLDIARRAAERAGGGLDATSAPAGGALVRVRFGA